MREFSSYFKKGRRGLRVAALSAIAVVAFAAVAAADDISNNLDGSVDAVAETMALNAGGTNGSTQLYVVPQNGDGKNGCNLTGSTTLTVSVSSSNTSVATVSPSSVTFDSCGDVEPLTVTPVGEGTAGISVAQTSNNTGATFNLAPASFTVNVAPAPPSNTAPTVTVTGVAAGGTYNKGSVPPATCNVTDVEDGNSSFPATPSAVTGPHSSDGIGSQTVSCDYEDAGGLTASASKTYNIVDPTGPNVSVVISGTLGNSGWYTDDVDVTWIVSDPDSPNSIVKIGCDDQHITADQASTSYSCSATSAGGPSPSGTTTVYVARDATAPVISDLGPTAAPDGNAGWYRTDVTNKFKAQDATSGLSAACDAAFDQTGDEKHVTISTEGAAQTGASGSCTDAAGNPAASIDSAAFKIDKTGPSITDEGATAGPNGDNGWYTVDVTNKFKATDGVSGLSAACDAAFDQAGDEKHVTTSGEGSAVKVSSGPCSDVAGNPASSIDSAGFMIDKTDPVVQRDTSLDSCSVPGDGGWCRGTQTAGFSASDATSGLADSNQASFTKQSSTDGDPVNVSSGDVSDLAGNTASPISAGPFKIDGTAPVVGVTNVSNGATYQLGNVPAAGCTTTDAMSGVKDSATPSTSGGPVNSVTVTCGGAKDNAGNTGSASVTYNVVYNASGLFRPISDSWKNSETASTTLNRVKAGSSVPVKFSLGGFAGLLQSQLQVKSVQIVGPPNANIDPITATEVATPGSSGLSYDSSTDQYNYVWKTDKAWAGQQRQLIVILNDGTTFRANFDFVK